MSRFCLCSRNQLINQSGALGQAFTSDRFGRRGSILIWSAIFTIGTAIQTGTAYSVAQITFCRFAAGLGVGALSGMYSKWNGVRLTDEILAIVPFVLDLDYLLIVSRLLRLYNGETAPKALKRFIISSLSTPNHYSLFFISRDDSCHKTAYS